MSVRSCRDLRVWQRGMDLVCLVYALSRTLPLEERFALGDQLRRSAVSVPANIAEGHSRAHRREFLQFLAIAQASLTELETHLMVAERVGLAPRADTGRAMMVSAEVGRMLTVMRRRLGEPRLSVARGRPPGTARP